MINNDQAHVIVIPTRSTSSDRERVHDLTRWAAQVSNATLGTLLRRARVMHTSDEWRLAREMNSGPDKTKAFREARAAYGLAGSNDAVLVAQAHVRNSTWLSDHLSSAEVTAIGRTTWPSVNEWLLGKHGKSRFAISSEATTLVGNDNRQGLRIKDNTVVQTTLPIKRAKGSPLGKKALKLPLYWGEMPRSRRDYYQAKMREKGVTRCIALVFNDDYSQLFAHVTVRCAPYRSEAARERVGNDTVTLDLGTRGFAMVTSNDQTNKLEPTNQISENINKERRYRKRQQRALDRSIRNTNRKAFGKNGQRKRGAKIILSKKAEKTKLSLRRSHARETATRAAWHDEVAREVISHGVNLVTEADTPGDWQASGYGVSAAKLAPGALRSRVIREVLVMSGSVTELSTFQTKLSSTCVCGREEKKLLQEREHVCPNTSCPLHGEKLDRDLFSAQLMLLVHEHGVNSLKNKKICTPEHVTTIIENTSVSSTDYRKQELVSVPLGKAKRERSNVPTMDNLSQVASQSSERGKPNPRSEPGKIRGSSEKIISGLG